MNIFILGTGRCGTYSFIEASKHIKNFTSGHETRRQLYGDDKFHYPKNHIEADNRLVWLLGRLDTEYGDKAMYIHLRRDKKKVAESYNKRWNHIYGIIHGYARSIIGSKKNDIDIIYDYIETVEKNIQHFLKDKSQTLIMDIESIENTFPTFWKLIKAKGNLQNALDTFKIPKNTHKSNLRTKLVHLKQRIFK